MIAKVVDTDPLGMAYDGRVPITIGIRIEQEVRTSFRRWALVGTGTKFYRGFQLPWVYLAFISSQRSRLGCLRV